MYSQIWVKQMRKANTIRFGCQAHLIPVRIKTPRKMLILYLNAFGFQKTERFFTEKVYRRITLAALTFYCLAKSYSFYTGANGLESHIPLGTPGAILSSGLILPLNICVGLVVACTMYAFYTLFRKGGM